MKLLVIGQSVKDHINYKNSVAVKPGGIYYSVSALYNIRDEDDEIYLCTGYRKGDRLFSALYEKVKKDFINYTDVIPEVKLNIYDDREREEIYKNVTGRLIINTDDLKRFDGILINMVTGFDISLEQMRQIRANFDGPVYFDIHTFSRGLNEKMERKFRLIPDIDKWLQNIDILQVNSRELYSIMDTDDKSEIIKYVLRTRVKYLLETKGDEGSVCFNIQNSKISGYEMPALKVDIKNRVGLGDVFGAVFFYSYIKNNTVATALKDAVTAGGFAAKYDNLDDFNNLKNDVFSRNN